MHRAHVLTRVQSCLKGGRETAAAAAKDLQIPELALIDIVEKKVFSPARLEAAQREGKPRR